MELYLFRHGIAENGVPGAPDSARNLTAEGRKKVARVVKLAAGAGVEPSLILSSPYARAIQTAEIAAKGFGYKGQIVQSAAVVPHGHPRTVWDEIRDYSGERAIVLASHEPLLGHLMAWLLASPTLQVDVKKAAMARIDLEAFGPSPRGILRWMITAAFTEMDAQ